MPTKNIEIMPFYGKEQKLYYTVGYENTHCNYLSSQEKEGIVNRIISSAPFDTVFDVSTPYKHSKKTQAEIDAFKEILRRKINKPAYQERNLRIEGDAEPANAAERLQKSTEKKMQILSETQSFIKKASRFPWFIFSGIRNIPEDLSAKKIPNIIHNFKERMGIHRDTALALAFFSLFVISNPYILAFFLIGTLIVAGISHLKIIERDQSSLLSEEFLRSVPAPAATNTTAPEPTIANQAVAAPTVNSAPSVNAVPAGSESGLTSSPRRLSAA